MTPCRCGEPRTTEHRCWATQAAELEALREVEQAAAECHERAIPSPDGDEAIVPMDSWAVLVGALGKVRS